MPLAACLIVMNEEHCIERILGNITPHVDGVFVYDTGSNDQTPELAERMGAQVLRGEWRSDFAWARNQSYGMPGDEFDWIVYCDADDTIEGAENLRGLAADALSYTTAFSFPYENTWGNLQVDYYTKRLVRRNLYYWRWPLHEQLYPIGEEHVVENDEVVWSQAHSLEDRQSHTQRNLELLEAYAQTHELDDWLASAIVLTLIEQGRAREAHRWLIDNKYVMEITRRA